MAAALVPALLPAAAPAQPARIFEHHYGAPCPAATKYDSWCEAGEAVVGQRMWVPGGAGRVLRVEIPSGMTITRVQLSMGSGFAYARCAMFDVRRVSTFTSSECVAANPAEPTGRGRFDAPRINGTIVTVAFTNLEPYIQEPYLRVYYLK
jgi:hypothetical protein